MQHAVQVMPARNERVRIEEAVRIVRTRGKRQTRVVHAKRGQGLGTTHGRMRAASTELVVVRDTGQEPGGVHLHGEVALCTGAGAATGHHVAQARVPRYAPTDIHDVVGAADACPQQHAVGQGVAAGHAMLENAIGCVLAGGGLGKAREHRSRSQCGSGGQEMATRVLGYHAPEAIRQPGQLPPWPCSAL